MKKIRVLIIEDSKLMQEIIRQILETDNDIEVVGIAADPLIARELIKKLKPNVITLDIMLPHMDGITFLKNLMRLHPIPTIMISTLTESGSALALEALSIGAIDYLIKPTQKDLTKESFASELKLAVKNAALANVTRSTLEPNDKLQKIIYKNELLKNKLIAIGASTGGVEAIETILFQLPKVLAPVVIVQHIRKEFNQSFSKRIARLYGLSVLSPKELTELKPGCIYIAPAELNMRIIKNGDSFFSVTENTGAVNRHKPSIDVLFQSAAKAAGAEGIGILLTGMGSDGAEGLKAMHDAGAKTIVQDKETSVIWGMPSAAMKLNAVDYVLPIHGIAQQILNIMDEKMFNNSSLRS